MKFTGQIRVPEVDHPGVPATFVVDDNQAEVLLEGESLGRWSLFDVHVTRLVSNAFQVELSGEEITFLADEPVDFAYKGVEHMAEVWARYKTMTVPRRVVAVKRSRKGTNPSRIQEFQSAMLENLRREQAGESTTLAGEVSATDVPPAPPQNESPIEPVVETSGIAMPDPVIPLVTEADDLGPAETQSVQAPKLEVPSVEAENMAAERKALTEERALLEEQRRSLEQSLAKAELLERERLDAARVDIERIEGEKKALEDRHEKERLEAERLEKERREVQQLEAERLETERRELNRLEADRVEREREQEEALETQKRVDAVRLDEERKELAHLEAERVERERVETERLEAARLELEEVEHARAEAARVEMEKLENERLNLERLEGERLEREQAGASRVEKERLASEKERLATEKREAKRLKKEEAAAAASAAKVVPDDEPEGRVAEVLGTSAEGDLPENSKELIVDLGAFEQGSSEESAQTRPGPEPESFLVGVPEKAGIMGAVKAAFGRSGKNHIHEFTEAPGGIGMVRSICRECGYVSISSSD